MGWRGFLFFFFCPGIIRSSREYMWKLLACVCTKFKKRHCSQFMVQYSPVFWPIWPIINMNDMCHTIQSFLQIISRYSHFCNNNYVREARERIYRISGVYKAFFLLLQTSSRNPRSVDSVNMNSKQLPSRNRKHILCMGNLPILLSYVRFTDCSLHLWHIWRDFPVKWIDIQFCWSFYVKRNGYHIVIFKSQRYSQIWWILKISGKDISHFGPFDNKRNFIAIRD